MDLLMWNPAGDNVSWFSCPGKIFPKLPDRSNPPQQSILMEC